MQFLTPIVSLALSLALAFGSWLLPSEDRSLPVVRTDVFFKTFTVEDGLPNQTVNSFAEDEQGFIWVGTLNGLSKFNGETFTNFKHSDDSLSIQNDEINEIMVLGDQIWLGTGGGLINMDIRSEVFTEYILQDAASQTIESIVLLGDHLWVGYESNSKQLGGIGVFNLKEQRFTQYIGIQEGINNVHELYLDPLDSNILWVASSELYSYDIAQNKFEKHSSPYNFEPLRRGCTSILRLDDQNLLIGTTRYGLLKYNTTTQEWSAPIKYNNGKSLSFFSPNYIKLITQVDEERIFLNTYDLGLIIYYPKTNQFSRYNVAENDPFATPSYRSHRTYKDTKGRLWHGFYSNFNVVIDNLQMISLQNTGIEGDVSIPLVTKEGIEFISEGQHYLITENGVRRKYLELNKSWNYAEADQEDNIYYLYDDALYLKRRNKSSLEKIFDQSILPEADELRRTFKHLSIDSNGQVWVTSGVGVVVIYDSERGASVIPIKNNQIGICEGTSEASYRVAHGDHETLISHACGILIYNPEDNELVDLSDHLGVKFWEAERWTYTIAHLSDQTYIVGSFREGLHIIDLKKKETHSVSSELDDIIISTITTTDEHTAWCLTDAGLIYYNHLDGSHRVLNSDDGLPSDYLIFQSAVPFDSTTLIFGGPNNLVYINTEQVKERPTKGAPIITSILAKNKSIHSNFYLSDGDPIHLAYGQNDLEVSFSHLTTFEGEAAEYFYQMEGLSDIWVNARNTDQAIFFDLDPGHYDLHLASSNPETSYPDINTIAFIISPPFWATLWFRILSLLSIGGVFYYLYINRIRQIRNRALLEQEEKENDQLKSQNELINQQNLELQKLNQSKDKFFSILAHDLRAPLAAFSGLGKQLNYHIDRKNYKKIELLSNHIQGSSEKLTGLVDNLLNWSLVQTGRFEYQPDVLSLGEVTATITGQLQDVINQKEVNVIRKIHPHSIVLVDSQSLHIIIRNLLSNAIKFSHPGGEIKIVSENKDHLVNFSIQDEGVGISQAQIDQVLMSEIQSSPGTSGEMGVGLGLQMCQELVKMNKGSFVITPNPDQGTTVTISLPKET